jgi:alcohol dehydrogenase (cytochrome c)
MHTRIARIAAALLLFGGALGATAQELADLRNDAATPADVTTYGMGWAQNRHAPGRQITPANVKNLAPVWNLSLDNNANASSQPLLVGDTMYLATHTHTIAIDPLTGRQKWKTAVEIAPDVAATSAAASTPAAWRR